MPRVNLPRGSVDDLQRGVGCVELLAQLSPPGVSDKKPSAFVDVAFHPLKPWVAAIEPKGCGVVWDYEMGDVVTEFDLGESQVLDDDEVHGIESEEAEESVAPKISRASASPSARTMQGAVAAATAAKGLLSPTGASLIKPRRRPTLQMLFYDHEAIACTTQFPASRTCFDEWLIIVARSHIVICDLDQNGAVDKDI
ncbi:hypothetical protein PHMEG_00027358 [Phytophthora megakarya]|uniref:Uncharacterized protein n=1 Tax=Phytophthora megakarya TaxID=4795 RepID=A0A225VA15_9STRA|nr:hypothetical protein PHMEG_00027358 [Phytophthora megakarya]